MGRKHKYKTLRKVSLINLEMLPSITWWKNSSTMSETQPSRGMFAEVKDGFYFRWCHKGRLIISIVPREEIGDESIESYFQRISSTN